MIINLLKVNIKPFWTFAFFYTNLVYKNILAQICPKIKNILRLNSYSSKKRKKEKTNGRKPSKNSIKNNKNEEKSKQKEVNENYTNNIALFINDYPITPFLSPWA